MRGNGDSTLPLLDVERIVTDIDCDTCCLLVICIELMTDLLTESEHYLPYLCGIFKILQCGNSVSNGFDRNLGIDASDFALIESIGKPPQVCPAFSELSRKKIHGPICDVTDRSDAKGRELLFCSSSYPKHFGCGKLPDHLFEVFLRDTGDSIGLLHVAAQL